MSDLVEFLRDRISEDRAWADNPECTEDPARVLREVEAKRRMLERHQPHSMGDCRVCEAPHWGIRVCNHCFGKAWPCPCLRDLASVYADHPDYHEEWKP